MAPTSTRFTELRCILLVVFTIFAGWPAPASAEPYADRFVWIFGWQLSNDAEVATITGLLETAAKHGINGAVFTAGTDTFSRRKSDYFRRLEELQRACERLKIELIPGGFSIGYAGGLLAENPNLAEGLEVRDAPFVVSAGEARFVPDDSVRLLNGGFEESKDNRFAGFKFHDMPGVISFADTQVKHGGSAAMRLENFTADPHGHGRVMQELRLRPHRCYRVSLWVRTQELQPVSGFQMIALHQKRELSPAQFRIAPTADWQRLTMLINSADCDSVRLYAGMWGGKGGKLWLDDWSIEEVGPINVLQRPGTPVTVRSDDGSVTYVEGTDYAPLRDPRFKLSDVNHDAVSLKVLSGGGIKDGQRLRVSWYHPMRINDGQITACMAEPQVYEIFDREIKLLAERLHPRRVFLNMDEIRMGGTCRACAGRDMGELLGECITKQAAIVHKYLPQAQVYIWSDMLDPNHNAHGDYYLVQGSFAGSWKHVPRELVMAVWGGEPREKSLRFFADEGFATLASCYYDADDLKTVQGWLAAARGVKGVRGFMYTPWQKKYKLLADFGELLQQQK